MLNTTGCGPALARDTFLIPHGILSSIEEIGCALVIPVYYVFQALFALVLFLVAVSRTQLWLKRQRKGTTGARKPNSLIALVSAYLLLGLSWISCIVIILAMIVPLATSKLDNSMIFLLGLQFFCFNLITERWLTKLIRLGSKILPKASTSNNKAAQIQSSSDGVVETDDTDPDARRGDEDNLARMDTMLKIGHAFLLMGIVVQIIMLCILAMAFPSDRIFLQIGVGLQGVNVIFAMFTMLWQYQRCTMAIIESTKNVQGLSPSRSRNKSMRVVTSKFRMHQFIIFSSGCIASVVFILWGFRVYEINYSTLIVTSLFDAICNGGVFITFIAKSFCGGRNNRTGNGKGGPYETVTTVVLNQNVAIARASPGGETWTPGSHTSFKTKVGAEDAN